MIHAYDMYDAECLQGQLRLWWIDSQKTVSLNGPVNRHGRTGGQCWDNRHPIILFQITARLSASTSRWNLQVTSLQMSCRPQELTSGLYLLRSPSVALGTLQHTCHSTDSRHVVDWLWPCIQTRFWSHHNIMQHQVAIATCNIVEHTIGYPYKT